MILSDAIILDVEDAQHLCDVVKSVLYGSRKKKESLSKEQTESYYKIQNIVDEMVRRKLSVDSMQDAIEDIKKAMNPDKFRAY